MITKIVEFILGLDVFENERLKSTLISELANIQSKWSEEKVKIGLLEEDQPICVMGVKRTADDMFDPKLVSITKQVEDSTFVLSDYIVELVRKIEAIDEAEKKNRDDVSIDLIEAYESSKAELDQLASMLDSANAEIRLSKARLAEYLSLKSEIEKDLEKIRLLKNSRNLVRRVV